MKRARILPGDAEGRDFDRVVIYAAGLGITRQLNEIRLTIGIVSQTAGEYIEGSLSKGDTLRSRPQLVAALNEAKRVGCPVAIARIGVLGKNPDVVTAVARQEVDFALADIGDLVPASALETVSRMERFKRREISLRTKAALREKRQAVPDHKFGNPNPREASVAGGRARAADADAFAARVIPHIKRIQASGAATLRDIADELERRRVPTARGGAWSPIQVKRVLDRSMLKSEEQALAPDP